MTRRQIFVSAAIGFGLLGLYFLGQDDKSSQSVVRINDAPQKEALDSHYSAQMQIGPNSTPLCTSKEALDRFIAAIQAGSNVSADSVCYMGKEGMEVDVLEDLGAAKNPEYGRILRINVNGGGMTLPAYTLSEGLAQR